MSKNVLFFIVLVSTCQTAKRKKNLIPMQAHVEEGKNWKIYCMHFLVLLQYEEKNLDFAYSHDIYIFFYIENVFRDNCRLVNRTVGSVKEPDFMLSLSRSRFWTNILREASEI